MEALAICVVGCPILTFIATLPIIEQRQRSLMQLISIGGTIYAAPTRLQATIHVRNSSAFSFPMIWL